MKHDAPDDRADRAARALHVDADALDRLRRFERLLIERAVPRGLVARSDRDRVRERHVLDCLRAVAAVEPSDRTAYDMGSGAGLPGLVVALARPRLHVRLVEPRSARAAFLELAVEALTVPNAEVVAGRIEDQSEPADLCFARAFAPLGRCWDLARSRLRRGGRLVYFAGASSETIGDLPEARAVRVVEDPVLESPGPLVIMTR